MSLYAKVGITSGVLFTLIGMKEGPGDFGGSVVGGAIGGALWPIAIPLSVFMLYGKEKARVSPTGKFELWGVNFTTEKYPRQR